MFVTPGRRSDVTTVLRGANLVAPTRRNNHDTGNSVGTYNGAQAGTWSEASPQYMKFQMMNPIFIGAWK